MIAVENCFQFLGKSRIYDRRKWLIRQRSSILSTGTFALCLCLYVLLWLCRQNIIFIWDGTAHTDHDTLHRNLPLYAVKKQNKNSNFIKSQDSDWRRIDKGLVYLNACCIITATTIYSNTAWYIMKHRLRSDLWILTGKFREHLTETYDESSAKKGCRGRWLKLVEIGLQSSHFSSSSFFFSFSPRKSDEALASCLVCLKGSYAPDSRSCHLVVAYRYLSKFSRYL